MTPNWRHHKDIHLKSVTFTLSGTVSNRSLSPINCPYPLTCLSLYSRCWPWKPSHLCLSQSVWQYCELTSNGKGNTTSGLSLGSGLLIPAIRKASGALPSYVKFLKTILRMRNRNSQRCLLPDNQRLRVQNEDVASCAVMDRLERRQEFLKNDTASLKRRISGSHN